MAAYVLKAEPVFPLVQRQWWAALHRALCAEHFVEGKASQCSYLIEPFLLKEMFAEPAAVSFCFLQNFATE